MSGESPLAAHSTSPSTSAPAASGLRITSLALNLPGPAALMRLRALGASCVKIEPPSGDPMALYSPHAYAVMHAGIRVRTADLKTDEGRKLLHDELAAADVLLTSFRPSALRKLGLEWAAVHQRYPRLSMVAIVGASGDRAEEPGHDLTYMADNDLVVGLDLPPTLFADMGGALMATEAVLQSVLMRQGSGAGVCLEVALSDAAAWLALPRTWGLTAPEALLGGAHAGYRVYACKDGRVAVAALEPHFALTLFRAAGLDSSDLAAILAPETRHALEAFFASRSREELEALGAELDIPLHTLA